MTDAAETKLSGSNLGTNTVEGSLQACIGECDKDVDCATGLLCFQRSNGEDIPGCTGNGGGNGWCVLSPLFPLKCLAPPVTSNSPVASPPHHSLHASSFPGITATTPPRPTQTV